MRKYFLVLVCIFSWNTTFAEENTECFTQRAREIFGNSKVLIETPSQDFIAIQNNIRLQVYSAEYQKRYLEFQTSDISLQISKSPYKNIFSSSLDSQEIKEITLDTSLIPKNTAYDLHFDFSANHHAAKFYISQDGKNYSQVSQNDISEFSPKKIKIALYSIKNEEIREKIEIHEISLQKKNYTSLVSGIKENIPVDFYVQNTCEKSKKFSETGENLSQIPLFSLALYNNSSYLDMITDSDDDGIFDNRDNCKYIKNPDQKDVNQNTIGDACEFDTDSDGIPDEVDSCRNVANPDQKDTDFDGIGDKCDNCERYNPDQFDTDNNGRGDRCDAEKKYLEENDSDTDGKENSQDNCPEIANPFQEDDDQDGIGNVCDNCKMYQNSDQKDENTNGIGDICEDSDKDGREGLQDNCMNIANPEQEDSDNDGIGNVCEDDDADGILFQNDNCPYEYNPEQNDFDKDAMGDVCDKKDNRFFESNKNILIVLLFLGILGFIGGIGYIARKIQK